MDVEVQTLSAFSFLRGASLPEELVDHAADLGYGAIALLDRDGLYGTPRFHAAAKARGLRAMVGAVLSVEHGGVRGVLGLYACDRAGYRNLCRLITAAKLRTPKKRARTDGVAVTLGELADHRAGLAALLLADEAPFGTMAPGDPRAFAWARAVVGVLGPGRCFVEQGRHLVRGEARSMARMRDVADALGARCVATNGVRYATRAASQVADVLACLRLHTTLDEAGRALDANAERHLKPPATMRALFRDTPVLLDNARTLAELCDFTLEDLGYRFPDHPLASGETLESRLRDLVEAGAVTRYGTVTPAVRRQLETELELIGRLGFPGYFLIVHDIVDFCRTARILVQGRGSAANSVVCYVLGITAVDPVGMKLLFERFLSESRDEWPDIDLDLPSGDQREKVIQYVYTRYGEHGAAMTANVITYRGRSAMRDAGRALGFPMEMLDRLADNLHWSGADENALRDRVEGAGFSTQDARVATLVDVALKLQDLPRHLGQHSGGMVIAAGRLDEVVPLEPATMPGRVVVQWDKEDCADLHILKVDLLGLGMMALLEEVIPTIRTHDGVEIDLARLPPDDPDTYAMMRAADTIGVFQIESRAQMATLPRMKPERFYDLVVEVAIIRPGPITGGMLNPYLERRAGRQQPEYWHPSLEPILERTLGVPLFQEQLMRMAMTAANFTGGEAEELRRAMGHKRSVARMTALEAKLRAGMAKNGIAPAAQDEIAGSILSFAQYGFPESHAASFALLAYASAYIRCHYTASFTCALLNQWPMGFYHPATIVKDAQRHGVSVRAVDVTRSDWLCTREEDTRPGRRGALRLGLKYVTGLHKDVGRAVEIARAERPFASLDDFAARTGANAAAMATLADLGAFAGLPHGRTDSAWTRRDAIWQVKAVVAKPEGGLFERAETPRVAAPLEPMTLGERIAADYRASGLTVGPHPMVLRRDELTARGVMRLADFVRAPHGTAATIAGAVVVRQRPGTAKGFFFVTLEDETGIGNAIIAPALFDTQRVVFVTKPWLVLHGVVERRDGVVNLKVAYAESLGNGTADDDPSHPASRDFH